MVCKYYTPQSLRDCLKGRTDRIEAAPTRRDDISTCPTRYLHLELLSYPGQYGTGGIETVGTLHRRHWMLLPIYHLSKTDGESLQRSLVSGKTRDSTNRRKDSIIHLLIHQGSVSIRSGEMLLLRDRNGDGDREPEREREGLLETKRPADDKLLLLLRLRERELVLLLLLLRLLPRSLP